MKFKNWFIYVNEVRKIYQNALAMSLAPGNSNITEEKKQLKRSILEDEKIENATNILNSSNTSEEKINKIINLNLYELPRKETHQLIKSLDEKEFFLLDRLFEKYEDSLFFTILKMTNEGISEKTMPVFKYLMNLREKLNYEVDYTQLTLDLINKKAPIEIIELSVNYLIKKNRDDLVIQYDENFLADIKQGIYAHLNTHPEIIKINSLSGFLKELPKIYMNDVNYLESVRHCVDKNLAIHEKKHLEEKIAHFRQEFPQKETKKSNKI